ncbi:hypothetical protein COCMIDRAFT_38713 [Bipolaris oryzae ATCC 44560]|uniref:Dienelactone hydrolase domain-containing protein n=1 Tax=Bipolaris oryzae ATCC 44560 TaxID=930090 RepID=W6Z0C1_COCMI|nr:uncharacterized protein COCMIDRAFT_38713 [Bipolaris oryzae ATCC 44560]EUC43350.1 hypothetical protein COCMIDRAFT_38713 [Bipolaris oryzae ATCC 44560]
MSLSKCCIEGKLWDGEPVGEKRSAQAKRATYLETILKLHADQYAKEVNTTVYMLDFYGGEVLPAEFLKDMSQLRKVDLPGVMVRSSKETREPELLRFATELGSQYNRVGAISFCRGGWAVFKLGARSDSSLVYCISAVHPSLLEKLGIEQVEVLVQILAPENDFMFSPEMNAFANRAVPRSGVSYDYQHFLGV